MDGLPIIDVRLPSTPVEAGFYDTPGSAAGVMVSGSNIYIADLNSGLFILRFTGEISVYTISGRVTDVGGAPLSEVNVSAGPDYSAFSDIQGYYTITDVISGSYTITPTLSNYAFTPPIRNITVPTDALGQDFIGEMLVYTISGRITDVGGDPLSGVSLSAGPDYSAVSDSQGYYTITDVISGSYTITPTLSNYAFTPPIRNVTVPLDALGQDFIGEMLVYTISGRITDVGGDPLSGVSLSAGPDYSAVSDSQGYYTITEVISGSYTITPTLSNYTFSPPIRNVTVPPDAIGQDFVGDKPIRNIYLPIIFRH